MGEMNPPTVGGKFAAKDVGGGVPDAPNMRKFRSRLLIWKKSLSMTNSAAKSLKMN